MTNKTHNSNTQNYSLQPKKKPKAVYIFLTILAILIIFILLIIFKYPQFIGQTIVTKAHRFSPNTFNSSTDVNPNINSDSANSNDTVIVDNSSAETLEKLDDKTNVLNAQITSLQNQLSTLVNELKTNKTESQKIELALTGSRLVAALQQGLPFDTYLERFVYLNNNSNLNRKLLEIQKYSSTGLPTKNQIINNYNELYKSIYLQSLKNTSGIKVKLKYYFSSLFFIMNTKKTTNNTTLINLNNTYYNLQNDNYENALKTLELYANNEDVITLKDNINALIKGNATITLINEELNNLISKRSLHVK